MTEEHELEEPQVTGVPEPDQEPHEPTTPEDEEHEQEEAEETDTEPEATRDDAGIEKAFKSLAAEATRHANRISAIMGEDAQMLQPCPRCVTTDPQRPPTPGFIWPHEVVPLLPADKAAVKLSIGEGEEPVYKENDDAYVCSKCLGEGKYPTGSHVRDQKFIKCDLCDGRGWLGQRALNIPAPTVNGPPQIAPVVVGGDEPRPESDPWGRLKGDPLYGVMPGFEQ